VKAGVYRGWFTVDGCKDVGSIFITRFCLFVFHFKFFTSLPTFTLLL
jgi:hypothetical protein